jgi:hypothetical protein
VASTIPESAPLRDGEYGEQLTDALDKAAKSLAVGLAYRIGAVARKHRLNQLSDRGLRQLSDALTPDVVIVHVPVTPPSYASAWVVGIAGAVAAFCTFGITAVIGLVGAVLLALKAAADAAKQDALAARSIVRDAAEEAASSFEGKAKDLATLIDRECVFHVLIAEPDETELRRWHALRRRAARLADEAWALASGEEKR